MNKIIIIPMLFLLLMGSHPVFGQMGVKAGLTSTHLTISENEGRPFFGYEIEWLFWNRRTSYQLGFFKEITLTGYLKLLAELDYARRGLDASTDFIFDEVRYLIKIDYIQLPLALKLRFPVGKRSGLGMYAGGYGALKIRAIRQNRIDGIEERIKLPNVRTFDYGFITGIGLDRTLLGKTFTFDLRFELGFPSIMDEIEDAVAVSDEEGAVKNQAILFLLGIVLN